MVLRVSPDFMAERNPPRRSHRVLDVATAAQFLKRIKEPVESPARILI